MLHPLSAVRNLKDPIKQFCCNFQIAFDASSKLASLIDSKDIELRCQTFGLPTITGDKTTVQWSGFERRYGGRQTRAGDWSIEVTESYDSRVVDAFRRWNNAYHNYKDGKISLLKEYTATVDVTLCDKELYETAEEIPENYHLRMFDVFPTQVSFPTINASSSEAVTLSIQLSYNYFLMGEEID